MRRCALLLTLLVPVPAAAQDAPRSPAASEAPEAVVLTVGGDAEAADARVAREAVAAALAAEGLTVLPAGDVALRIPPSRLRACRETACARAIGAELGVSMVAAVATWSEDGAPSSLTVSLIVGPSRSHTATEPIGEEGLAAAARAAVTAAQASRRRALLVEGTASAGSLAAPDETDAVDEERIGAPDSPLQRERSLEEWILPSLLGVVGLGLVGTAVYALLDEQCDLRGASGVCLRGNRPNIGLGVLFSVVGGLSVAGAILWLVMGGQPPDMGDIDVVVGPDGGGMHWRGRF
jgi:hypothetical protein